MATGVLILGVNRATRLLGHLALHDKRYLATVRLGQGSTTDDADGEVAAVADASGITPGDLESALASLRGRIQQVPSAVSAIKVNGKRAYDLARRGMEVKLKAREVEVTRLDVLASHPGEGILDVDIDVECSSGTYVRAIARDLGKSLGVGGHLTALRRTRIGSYDLSVAVELGEDPPTMMSMADAAKRSFPCVTVDLGRAADVGFGRRLDMTVPADVTGILSPAGELLALYRPDGDGAKPVAVLV
jgi:tRNA pseudouridine synthase B